MDLQTQIVVIGGGATGTAVLRDLSMRGFDAVLVERGNLCEGTSGNFHGLLHSGGRYAMKDQPAARECILENEILHRIAPQAIEDTGGLFVALDDVDETYLPGFLKCCSEVGIPTELLSGEVARREEPNLSSEVRQAVMVPDGSIDGWGICAGNVASAKECGARVFTYTPVISILRKGDRVIGLKAVDQTSGEEHNIYADFVINSTGPWSHQISKMAQISIPMVLSKGTMIVLDHRPLKRVINRCRRPADGDIIVPVGTTIVLGTTSVEVSDPDHFTIEEWEVDKILDECIQMVPMIENMAVQRTYAAVRPLYEPPQLAGAEEGREVSRAFYVLDHEKLDGVGGFITITGGKLTTCRLMAEKTVDLVCACTGVHEPCRTHLVPLPS